MAAYISDIHSSRPSNRPRAAVLDLRSPTHLSYPFPVPKEPRVRGNPDKDFEAIDSARRWMGTEKRAETGNSLHLPQMAAMRIEWTLKNA